MKIKLKSNLMCQILCILIIIFNFNIAYSVNIVKLNDSKLNRSKSQLVPVLGKLDFPNITFTDIIDFEFQFDSRLLFFDKVVTNSNTFFEKFNSIQINNSKENPNESFIATTFIGKNENFTSQNELDTLFFLSVEALVGNDSIAYITPKLLNRNNTIVTDTSFTRGKFNIGFPIFDIEKESIGVFYPNPFGSYSAINFTLVKESTISFAIYSLEGKLVSKFPNQENNVKYLFLDSKNQVIEFNGNYTLPKDSYKLTIEPEAFTFSSGAYFIYIEINGNIHKTNFIYQK